MQKTQTLFSQNLYEKNLSTINNIHFTSREIDVMACLLSARRTSKIAYFLSINPRTVETHIRNIMAKLDCSGREGIIDFMEASGKIHILRKYYSLLQVEATFEKSLKEIAKLQQEKNLRCFLKMEGDKEFILSHLKSHLTLAGISVASSARKKEGDYIIVILPKTLIEEETSLLVQDITKSSNKVLFLLQERKNYKEVPKEFKNFDVIDFERYENYYFSFFIVLQKILPNLKIDHLVSNFKDKYKKILTEPNLPQPSSHQVDVKSAFTSRLRLRPSFLFITLGAGLLISGLLAFRWNQINNNDIMIRSELVVPRESILLNRPDLIAQIDDKFKKQEGIQVVALIGIGGAGKTTLARHYARSQQSSLVWEMNAETHCSLTTSFENLAQALAKTEMDQKILRGFQEIKEPAEKENRMTQFVKERLKSQPNWFLIYDNVQKFADIQKYFPQNPDLWGTGKVIITTQDGHFESNNPFVQIGELSSTEKLNLFRKIAGGGSSQHLSHHKEQIKRFLNEIPPFPLDVSIAAHYLKETNISYNKYLDYLKKHDDDFESIQKNILNTMGEYTRTRYSIVSLSLKHIINTHKDFRDLLLFISLLNHQNIPKNLLSTYKRDIIVDNFLYNLKKYSLVTNESISSFQTAPAISMHHSTQKICLTYFKEALKASKNLASLQDITNVVENYITMIITKEDYSEMGSLAGHFETFLKHNNLINISKKISMEGNLGRIYYHLKNYKKADEFINKSLANVNKYDAKNYSKKAQNLIYLGKIDRELGNYEKAINLIDQAITLYKVYTPENHTDLAWAYAQQGCAYRWAGDYEKAQSLLEQSLLMYKQHDPKNYKGLACVYAHLGNTYRNLGYHEKARNLTKQSLWLYEKYFPNNHARIAQCLIYLAIIERKKGNYEKARTLIERGLLIFKQHFSANHIDVAWAYTHLGITYSHLKEHEKAKYFLEQSIKIFKTHFSDDHLTIAYAMTKLGSVYREQKNYTQAKNLFAKCLISYEKNYGKDHIEIGRVFLSLGKTYLLEDNLRAAENYFQKALTIFQKSKHPEIYMVLEALAALDLQRSTFEKNKGNIQQAQSVKSQAIDNLTKALDAVKTYFPSDAPHIARIQAKLSAMRHDKKNDLKIRDEVL